MHVMDDSRAIAIARHVLPQPGLPYSTRPFDRGNNGILADADWAVAIALTTCCIKS